MEGGGGQNQSQSVCASFVNPLSVQGKCMIKIFRGGEGVVDGVGGSSERCLKWGGGGSLRDLSKNILK